MIVVALVAVGLSFIAVVSMVGIGSTESIGCCSATQRITSRAVKPSQLVAVVTSLKS